MGIVVYSIGEYVSCPAYRERREIVPGPDDDRRQDEDDDAGPT